MCARACASLYNPKAWYAPKGLDRQFHPGASTEIGQFRVFGYDLSVVCRRCGKTFVTIASSKTQKTSRSCACTSQTVC